MWPRLSIARRPCSRSSSADDRGLDLAAAADRVGERGGVERAELAYGALEPREELRVDDHAVLDHLREAGRELARRQRRERVRVGEHRDGLVERADHVLRARVVDGGLAADRRVDLREQRRRHLHEIDAALEARGRVARDVADHAAAERDEAAVAVEPRVDEPVDDRSERRERLVPLAIGQHDGLHVAVPERRTHGVQVERRDDLVADDQDLLRGGRCRAPSRRSSRARCESDSCALRARR